MEDIDEATIRDIAARAKDIDQAVRDVAAHAVAPMIAEVEALPASIARDALLAKLRDAPDGVLCLARERFPHWWRT